MYENLPQLPKDGSPAYDELGKQLEKLAGEKQHKEYIERELAELASVNEGLAQAVQASAALFYGFPAYFTPEEFPDYVVEVTRALAPSLVIYAIGNALTLVRAIDHALWAEKMERKLETPPRKMESISVMWAYESGQVVFRRFHGEKQLNKWLRGLPEGTRISQEKRRVGVSQCPWMRIDVIDGVYHIHTDPEGEPKISFPDVVSLAEKGIQLDWKSESGRGHNG